MKKENPDPLWVIEENTLKPSELRESETIFTLANGYRGLRGNLPFMPGGERGNFFAGVFDKGSAQVTELVNNADPLSLCLYFFDMETFEKMELDKGEIISFSRKLDMKNALYAVDIEMLTPKKKQLKIHFERFVSGNNVHRWAEKYEIIPVNFKGQFIVESTIDGSTMNSSSFPVNRVKHYDIAESLDLQPGIACLSKTRDKKVQTVECTILKFEREFSGIKRHFQNLGEKISEIYQGGCEEGIPITFFRLGVAFTSKDFIGQAHSLIGKSITDLREFFDIGFNKEKEFHEKRWEEKWRTSDIRIEGDTEAQKGIRFNIFHLLSCASVEKIDASIAAKGLHGEGYKGHVFWDTEIFMLPFYIFTQPILARNLLMYRFITLDGAKENAANSGYKGARFAWESADTGEETTPKWGVNYKGDPVRILTGEQEYHISADIAFAVWEYCRATGDEEFLFNQGIEIFVETALFWSDRLEWNDKERRFEINLVIGPDEFHEHVNNNVYTNFLAAWNLKKAYEILRKYKKRDLNGYTGLLQKKEISESDIEKWVKDAEKVYIPADPDTGVIEQFEGYFKLKEIPITEWDENNMPRWPKGIDLAKLHETKLIKQPDVLMLMYMMPEEFSFEAKKKNYEFYEKRTLHKSSLSPCIHSFLGLSVGDSKNAYGYFIKTVQTDLKNNQGNTGDGLHAASSGGAWLSCILGFGGVSVDKNSNLQFSPWLPKHWKSLSFSVLWDSALLEVQIEHEAAIFKTSKDIKIVFKGKETYLGKGKYHKFSVNKEK